jgi:hypothetical protein
MMKVLLVSLMNAPRRGFDTLQLAATLTCSEPANLIQAKFVRAYPIARRAPSGLPRSLACGHADASPATRHDCRRSDTLGTESPAAFVGKARRSGDDLDP